jgi:glyoxylase I family protein
MINIREIDHVVLRCKDLDRMLAFYRDVLCCPLESSQPGLIQLRAGRSLVDLVPASGPVEVLQRSGADGEGPSMYIHDPEGNLVELKGP